MLSQWIKEGVAKLSPASVVLDLDRSKTVRAHVRKKYVVGNNAFMWDGFTNFGAFRLGGTGDMRWQDPVRRLVSGRTIVFFESDEDPVLELENVQAVIQFICGIPPTDTYITDQDATYVICLNHHDYVIGVGLAAEAVQALNADS